MTEPSAAEFYRFVLEAREQRERADQLTAERDELVTALANLHTAVVKLTNADVGAADIPDAERTTHYEVANAVGLPALVAMQLVERYRNAAKLVGKEGATS